jgi:cytochrome c551
MKVTSSLSMYIFLSGLLFLTCLFISCNKKTESTTDTSSIKFNQYYLQGEKLYAKNCSNCHQLKGTGLGRLYPPIHLSDYMDKNLPDVICLMRYGKNGEVIVNGVSFNKNMPGIPSLSDLEIAEIATYVYNTWDHKHGMIDVSEVAVIQKNCSTNQ